MHLHRTSVPICHSNIQPFVLSVALATDQGSRNGCYNCTGQAGPYQPAVKMATNICSMQIPYSGVVLCVDTLHFISIYCKFYPSIQLTFFRTLNQKWDVHWSNFSVISSVQYTLSFITSFFEEKFSHSRIFMRIILILWYNQICPKVVWKVHGAWIDGYDSQNKDKTLPLRKIRVCYFFRAVNQSKKHVFSHPVIAAILNVILNILQRWKTTIRTMPVKFSKYNRKRSENSY